MDDELLFVGCLRRREDVLHVLLREVELNEVGLQRLDLGQVVESRLQSPRAPEVGPIEAQFDGALEVSLGEGRLRRHVAVEGGA